MGPKFHGNCGLGQYNQVKLGRGYIYKYIENHWSGSALIPWDFWPNKKLIPILLTFSLTSLVHFCIIIFTKPLKITYLNLIWKFVRLNSPMSWNYNCLGLVTNLMKFLLVSLVWLLGVVAKSISFTSFHFQGEMIKLVRRKRGKTQFFISGCFKLFTIKLWLPYCMLVYSIYSDRGMFTCAATGQHFRKYLLRGSL